MIYAFSDSKVHGANMGPILGRQVPGGPHVGPMNFAIWVVFLIAVLYTTLNRIVTATECIENTARNGYRSPYGITVQSETKMRIIV